MSTQEELEKALRRGWALEVMREITREAIGGPSGVGVENCREAWNLSAACVLVPKDELTKLRAECALVREKVQEAYKDAVRVVCECHYGDTREWIAMQIEARAREVAEKGTDQHGG